MALPPRSKAASDNRAERAERIAAMLDRWATEDVSGEPDWNVDELEPMALRSSSSRSTPAK